MLDGEAAAGLGVGGFGRDLSFTGQVAQLVDTPLLIVEQATLAVQQQVLFARGRSGVHAEAGQQAGGGNRGTSFCIHAITKQQQRMACAAGTRVGCNCPLLR